jgi:hypothetical protein
MAGLRRQARRACLGRISGGFRSNPHARGKGRRFATDIRQFADVSANPNVKDI